jgi:hypothetical protein
MQQSLFPHRASPVIQIKLLAVPVSHRGQAFLGAKSLAHL